MSSAPPPLRSNGIGWTAPNRRALIALLSLLLVVLSIRAARNRAFVPDPQPDRGARYDELASRVDPNTADWQTLAAIPMLGERRAKEIVAFRERRRGSDSGAIVFHEPRDLLGVRGIGLSMVENLKPYLLFPSADRPSTSP